MTTHDATRRSHDAITIRPSRADDAGEIAALHAFSWQLHYRGALSDAYLDGPVEAERRTVWRQRLDHPIAGQTVLLAEDGGALVGFVCMFANHDRDFGSLIDNLHVTFAHKGAGVGRLLMRRAGEALQHGLPVRPIYLYALAVNHPARGFYERIGGAGVEQGRHTEADGSENLVWRYVWDTPAALIAGCSRA